MMMVESIQGNSNNVKQVKEYIAFLIEMSIWECGKMINLMAKDYTFMQMVKGTKASSKMVENQEEEFTCIKVGQNMMVNGKKIKNMVLGYFSTQIIKNIKEIG